MDFAISPYYINARRTGILLGTDSLPVPDVISQDPSDKWLIHRRAAVVANSFAEWLAADPIQSLATLIAKDSIKRGAYFFHEGTFTCRGIAETTRTSQVEPRMTATLKLGSDVFNLTIQPHLDHVLPGSLRQLLTGRKPDLFVVAEIESISNGKIKAIPILVGERRDGHHNMSSIAKVWPTYIGELDEFKRANEQPHFKLPDRAILRQIPEGTIKNIFAELANDSNVPKDWGGEQSDFYTSKLTLSGKRVRVAFAFKGPAKWKMLQPADLGKNGDQIARLFDEPAELYVLQHCHEVSPAVWKTMAAFAHSASLNRKYCIVDGSDTMRVLRAYRTPEEIEAMATKEVPAPSRNREGSQP